MSPVALAYLLVTCAPNAHPETIASIVAWESGGDEFAIHDNEATRGYPRGRSFYPKSYADAVTLARTLVNEGHSVDLGPGQINSSNLPGLHRLGKLAGESSDAWVANIFKPGENIRAADYVLSDAWKTAVDYFGPSYAAAHPHDVVLNAIEDYNSNSLFRAPTYAAGVASEANSSYVVDTMHAAFALARAGLAIPGRCDTENLEPMTVASQQRSQPTYAYHAQASQVPKPPANAWLMAWLHGVRPSPAPTPIVKFSYHYQLPGKP